MRFKMLPLLSLLLAVILSSCDNESNYEKLVKRGLHSDIVIDTLFMGYHFGMEQEQFYKHSWELNKKKLITNGNGAQILREVNYLKYPANMLFYPGFMAGKIHQMRVVYSYRGWAPWNKDMTSEHLMNDLINYYQKKLDTEFQQVRDDAGNLHTVSVEGNREIEITAMENGAVEVMYRDLRVESNMKRFKKTASNL